MAQKPRENWASRLGFLLAAVGSAVGLGNMWRFSYLTAENGGAAFVLLYIVLTPLIALPVLLAEFMIGRGARRGPIGALIHFGGKRWGPLGWLFVASGFLILAYYSVIGGWTVRYGLGALLSGFPENSGEIFQSISTGPAAIFWHVVFMITTIVIVSGGIRRGIERTTLILMPVLFLLICGIAVYAYTLEGAKGGYDFYLQADFSKIFTPSVLVSAAGQAFFSLSLGMGAMMTYASYLAEHEHLPDESLIVAVSDFAVAFVAGLMVFPLIFALGLSSDVGGSTIGALFITLPQAFAEMGIAGRVVGFLFFAALLVGALTSAISLLEVVVTSAIDELNVNRLQAAILMGGAITLLGIPPALDINILGQMDAVAANLFLPVGGFALAIFVGWFMKDPLVEVSKGAEGIRWFFLWQWLLRIPVPLVLLFVIYESIKALAE
jgi:NSS family neurotransmitter:Na+ symporter